MARGSPSAAARSIGLGNTQAAPDLPTPRRSEGHLRPTQLPYLGVGLGYRRAIAPFYRRFAADLGFVEVMPEHWLDGSPAARAALDEATRAFPVVTHSVSLSAGSATGPDLAFAARARRVNRRLGALWTSDHLCITKDGARNIGQLTPFPYNDETLALTVANVRRIQREVGLPFLLENISQYFAYPGATIEEPDFFTQVTRRTGCGVLLDVTNLGNNVVNLGWNPRRYLDAFPLDRVVQLHLAGAERIGGKLLDTHGAPIHRETWRLTEEVVQRCDVRALLVERDQTFGPLPRLAQEVRRAGRIMAKARGAPGRVAGASGPGSRSTPGKASPTGTTVGTMGKTQDGPSGAGRRPSPKRRSSVTRNLPEPLPAVRRRQAKVQLALAALVMDEAVRRAWARRRGTWRGRARTREAGSVRATLAGLDRDDVEYYAQRRKVDRWSFLEAEAPATTALARRAGLLDLYFAAHPYPLEDNSAETRRFAAWAARQRKGPAHLRDVARYETALLRAWRQPPPATPAGRKGAADGLRARVRRTPGVRLLRLKHDLGAMLAEDGALQAGAAPPRSTTYVAIVRRSDRVARLQMDQPEYRLLRAARAPVDAPWLVRQVAHRLGASQRSVEAALRRLARAGLVGP